MGIVFDMGFQLMGALFDRGSTQWGPLLNGASSQWDLCSVDPLPNEASI